MQENIETKQPEILWFATITAMGERFGYYLLAFLLTLYTTNVYHFSDAQAFSLFALFTALSYITPAIGGYVADNIIGIKKAMAFGILLEMIGYFLLAVPTTNTLLFNAALSFVIVGAGLFKTAPNNLMGRTYKENDKRIDSGFTIFYTGINIGGVLASLVAGTSQKYLGWNIPFVFAGFGLLFAFVWFICFKKQARNCESKVAHKKISIIKWALIVLVMAFALCICCVFMVFLSLTQLLIIVASLLLLCYFIYEIIKSPKEEKKAIVVCVTLMLMAIVFYILYFQFFTSFELFIDRMVDRKLFEFKIPTVYFFSLNPCCIFLLSPFYTMLYSYLGKRGKDISITTKFPLGILLIGFCYWSFAFGTFFVNGQLQLSIWWVVLGIFLFSAGELLTSALGLAMVTKIAPKRLYGVMMGAWYLIAWALGANLSSKFANLASIPDQLIHNLSAMLPIYRNAFFKIGLIGVITAIIGFSISPFLNRIIKQ